MTLEEVVVAKLQQLPENERQQLLALIDAWIEQHRTTDPRDIQRAMAAVQSTWATVTLDQKTLRWVAEDKELFLAVKESALEEIPGLYPSLVASIDAGKQTDAQRYAHTIKGAARVIAATKTMNVAERIELDCAAGKLDAARASLEELKRVIQELVTTLNQSNC